MKRSIEVSTAAFSMIWGLRAEGEENEDQILLRVLSNYKSENLKIVAHTKEMKTQMGKIRWVDDVVSALENLGGRARLGAIYEEVSRIRKLGGRSVPRSLEATVRRTLEDFCDESDNFRGINLFSMPNGRGAGIWLLLPRERK